MLSIFHYVVGGLTALFGCLPIFHVIMGIAMLGGAFEEPGEPGPPMIMGWIFVLFPAVLIAFAWAVAAAIVVAGRKLAQHVSYTFCLVVAGVECVLFPFGTVLGVFTIIVLMRPSVKQLFGVEEQQTASGGSTNAP